MYKEPQHRSKLKYKQTDKQIKADTSNVYVF